MPLVRESRIVPLPVDAAARLWTDVERWPTFIEGFAHVIDKDPDWPAAGTKLVWESVPGGRGRVTERMITWVPPNEGPGKLAGQVFEESLTGTQTITFEAAEGGTRTTMELRYELQPTTFSRQGVIGKVADVLFIRRALSDSLARTLRRFATEAGEESAL
ncbi:MAG: SRPBCC family protein [Thermoleophilaceae bacterium]